VQVPEGFLVHTSGKQGKSSHRDGEMIVLASQGSNDHYPFVIAGRYTSAQIAGGKEKIILWARRAQDAAGLHGASEALARTMGAYESAFGARSKDTYTTWIVECPVTAGCFTNLNATTAELLGEEKEPLSAETVSPDTLMVDLSGGMPKLVAAATPSLAASWLGYAHNPGFYEQEPPLSALPAFAAAIGREAALGSDTRTETIRRALRIIPEKAEARGPEGATVVRAKSFLFFYALQDRYGKEVFRKAINHMLYARKARDFELSDLIASFDAETHAKTVEFVRIWMKRPGVPEEFRARYQEPAAATAQSEKETAP